MKTGGLIFGAEFQKVRASKGIAMSPLCQINEVLKTKQGRALHFGAQLKKLLKEGLALWHEYHDHQGQLAGFERRVGGRGEPAAAGRIRPASRPGQSAAVPRGSAGPADEQRLGAWVPVRGDPAQSVAVLEDVGWRASVRGVRQCDQDGDASGPGCGGTAGGIVPGALEYRCVGGGLVNAVTRLAPARSPERDGPDVPEDAFTAPIRPG